MIWSIGPFAVLANIVILLALAAAVAKRRMPAKAQPVVATAAFACTWIVSGALDALHAQTWTMLMSGAMIAASIVAVAVTVHLSTPRGDGGWRDDDGRGGPGDPPLEGPRGGGGETNPSWWPQFEREFARYVALCERRQREVLLPTASYPSP